MRTRNIIILATIIIVPIATYVSGIFLMMDENRNSGLNEAPSSLFTLENYSTTFSPQELESSFSLPKKLADTLFNDENDKFDGIRLYIGKDITNTYLLLVRAGQNGCSHLVDAPSNLEDTTIYCTSLTNISWRKITQESANTLKSNISSDYSKNGYFVGRYSLLDSFGKFAKYVLIYPRGIDKTFFLNFIAAKESTLANPTTISTINRDTLTTRPNLKKNNINFTIYKGARFYSTFYSNSFGLARNESTSYWAYTSNVIFGGGGGGGGNSKPCPPFGCND